jgi:tRNA(Leu) C34 or U34 (ribose-2'-O)-methylase TrmL
VSTAPLILAYHALRDPRALAEVIHLAAGIGAETHLLGSSLAPDHPKVLRKLRSWRPPLAARPQEIRSRRFDDYRLWVEAMQAAGVSIAAAVVEGGGRPWSSTPPGRLAVLFGEETHGIPRRLLAAADRRWTLPLGPGGRFYTIGQATALIVGGLPDTAF